jgi:predicted transcriptional regulator of viral defense system
MLAYYVKKGILRHIAHGLYSFSNYIPNDKNLKWEELAVAANNIPSGVICLISALNYYELTDEMMNEYWIAVPNDSSKVNFPMCRIVRMRNLSLGINEINLADMKVKIFSIERTIIDAFRILDFETAMKALKIYLSGAKGRPDLKKLNFYIKTLRASKVREYIMAVTA